MKISNRLIALSIAMTANIAWAQSVSVADGWVRATVPGQKATGAFMKITAKDSAKLVSAASPSAGVVEIHEMKMEKDIMKMASIPSLSLPSGKTVELKPGGFHVMLMDLKSPIANNSKIPLVLHFQDAKGVKSQMDIQVEAGMPHQH